jgi:hypothetical protein
MENGHNSEFSHEKLWKDPPFFMGKFTIMAIFHSYIKLPEGRGFCLRLPTKLPIAAYRAAVLSPCHFLPRCQTPFTGICECQSSSRTMHCVG